MADVDRSTGRLANPVAITNRLGKEAAVERVEGFDALATFDASTLPTATRDVLRQQVAYQRLVLVELRVLSTLLQEQVTGWYDLDQMRQDIDRELGVF